MRNRLFGRLGNMIKGNVLVALLFVAVAAAGVFSYNTITKINRRLENQHLEEIKTTPSPEPQQEPVQDVQTPQQNVPLPGSVQKQEKPRQTKPETETAPPSQEETVAPRDEKFRMPVNGKIYAAYSGDELVYNRTLDDWRTHNGIDITARHGDTVQAGTAGTVVSVTDDGMMGKVVEINHGDYTVRYCGLAEKVFVRAGDNVSTGQSIGTVGEITMEVAEESHIHLEVIRDGSYINPDLLLK
ncbi:MAG: peptidoglycan DD-metalloendopeptidase family protein [Oscillospiraceae bacterium]|nr:peptidoglycan DD-metalloendopeptidase family protein [Oscillospiraceae bacterium]